MAFLVALCLFVSRGLEAMRELEQFTYPNEDRSVLWHWAKYPQYLCWCLSGFDTAYCLFQLSVPWYEMLAAWAFGLILGYAIHKVILGR